VLVLTLKFDETWNGIGLGTCTGLVLTYVETFTRDMDLEFGICTRIGVR
jgi:hypothetical protein